MSDTQDSAAVAELPPPAPPEGAPQSPTSSTQAQPVATKKPEIVRPSSLPKPSGLKPPTKIGRLCSNAAPKPAVPVSPRTDGSTDTPRKLSDDSRKHLSDLIEAEEDEVSSSLPERPRPHRKASTSSTFSGTSMDALWEKHPRRLSEAGLRRSSDHSVVLTEDTDSFIIGERVWVGGTKPGQIAYIGETQFAPGEWAGIVLDEPIGKNDGSVAGVRYFQCSEKRGVFSRLTRLTRAPLASHDASPVSDAGSVFERPPSAARYRRALSPNGSIRSVVSSKMNASISTTTNGELRLGDRVIVSSSRGSKAGTLRYVGVADFASGVWAGVELDDPLGKNDGSVEGKRYFECAPRFGLFAPISKVSRSPSNRKPGACAVHSNGRHTPLRRSNSRESLTSLGTSVASSRAGRPPPQLRAGPRATSTPVSAKNALQELLREKQHHLERLMRERELERAEVAKVSLQAERAESALTQLRKENTQATTENGRLKTELEKINKLLEDERQKVEDLMFRNEEENINKEDYNKYKEAMEQEKAVREQRIRDLEAEAALQCARAETTAATLRALEDTRTAELATLSEQHKEELTAAHTLSTELQKLLDEAYALLKEKENEKDSLGKSMSDELAKVKLESEKALNEAKSKMAIAQTEFETQMSVLTAKLQLAESKLESEKQNLERLNKENSQTIVDLNSKLAQLQATVDDKTLELNKVMGTSKEHEVNLNKEITKLKMELSAKVLDIEQLEDSKKKQEAACKNLQEEIAKVKDEFSSKVNEYESLLNDVTQQNEKNKTEINELQRSLSAKIKDYERLLNETSTSNNSSEKLIHEYMETIHERDKEIIKLKDDFEQATANFNISHSKIAEEHKKEIENRNSKIEQLTKEIENHKQALDQSKVEFDTLNSQFITNVDELKGLKEENEKLKQSVTELTQSNIDLKARISAMELEIGELQRQYNSANEKCSELQKAKEKVESEYMNLTGQATDSNEQFNKLSQHLKDTEKELQELKDKYRESSNNHGRIEQEIKQKLFKLQEDFSAERVQLVSSLDENIENFTAAQTKLRDFEIQIQDLNNRIRDTNSTNDRLLDENSILKKEIELLKIKEQDINTEFESIRKKLEVEIDRYKEEISILKAQGATSEVKLMEKVDQLTEAQNDLNNKLEESRKHEEALQKILDDMSTQLSSQKANYEKEINHLQTQLSAAVEESTKLNAKELRLNELIEEKQNNVKELTLKLEMLEVDLKSNQEIIQEKDRQIAQINEELNKSTANKKQLEEKLNSIFIETTAYKQKYDNLLANVSADESVLKERLNQLETLKVENSALAEERNNLELRCIELSSAISAHKEEKLKENYVMNDLQKTITEKEHLLKNQIETSEMHTNKIRQLEEVVNKLKEDMNIKDSFLHEKELQLNKLNEELKLGTNETQQVITQLQLENDKICQNYIKEIESLNNTTKSLHMRISEQENQIVELQQAKEKVNDLQELLAKSDRDIKQLTNINEGQKANYEDLNKQIQLQFDEYKKEAKRAKNDLKVKLNQYEKELQEFREKTKSDLEKHNQLQQKLTDTEKQLLEVTQKLELISVQHSDNKEKDHVLEKLTLELQATRKSSAEVLASSEAIVNNLKTDVDHKIKDLKHRDEIIARLQEELKNHKAKLEILEREKILMQKDINEKTKKDKNDNNAMGILGQGDSASQKSIEDKEMLDGQVTFLNSVIVDMQRKNEQLMARVQALESGSVASDSPVFNGRTARAIAPRLFCDICDVFDAHDTEDCPRQAADIDTDAPAPPALGKTPRKPPPPPRPYCDICEVFGHATEDCDEEETF